MACCLIGPVPQPLELHARYQPVFISVGHDETVSVTASGIASRPEKGASVLVHEAGTLTQLCFAELIDEAQEKRVQLVVFRHGPIADSVDVFPCEAAACEVF